MAPEFAFDDRGWRSHFSQCPFADANTDLQYCVEWEAIATSVS